MDYEKLISETLKGKIGEFVVTNSKGDILYRNHAEDFTDENWKMWADINLDSEVLTTMKFGKSLIERMAKHFAFIQFL